MVYNLLKANTIFR